MNKIVIGTFAAQRDAERAVNELQTDLQINIDEISYLYRDSEELSTSVPEKDRTDDVVDGGVTGATIGAGIGTIAGLATVAGVIPFIGPVFAAGPLISALGIGAGAAATTAAGAVTGAVAGGLVGALVKWGVPTEIAQSYQDRLNSGEILVAVMTEDTASVEKKLVECNARSVTTHTPV